MRPTPTSFQSMDDVIMAMIGLETLAYIRPLLDGFGVFAADGTQLAVFDTHETAYLTLREHNLEPVSIH